MASCGSPRCGPRGWGCHSACVMQEIHRSNLRHAQAVRANTWCQRSIGGKRARRVAFFTFNTFNTSQAGSKERLKTFTQPRQALGGTLAHSSISCPALGKPSPPGSRRAVMGAGCCKPAPAGGNTDVFSTRVKTKDLRKPRWRSDEPLTESKLKVGGHGPGGRVPCSRANQAVACQCGGVQPVGGRGRCIALCASRTVVSAPLPFRLHHAPATARLLLLGLHSQHACHTCACAVQAMREEFWDTEPHYGGDRGERGPGRLCSPPGAAAGAGAAQDSGRFRSCCWARHACHSPAHNNTRSTPAVAHTLLQ